MFDKSIKKIYDGMFNFRCDDPGYNKYYTYQEFDGMKEEKFSFVTRKNNTLRGGLYYSGGSIDEYEHMIVFLHGMTCGYLAYMNEINMLVKAGFLVLSYDYTATFSSDGDSLEGFGRPLVDFQDAMKAIEADGRLNKKSISLVGHSWGGYAAVNAVNMFDMFDCAVCLSPVLSYKAAIKQNFNGSFFGKLISPHVMNYERKIFGDVIDLTGLATVEKPTPILFVYSKDDPTVSYKYHYKPLEDIDDNPRHERIVFEDRDHFPQFTKRAIEKFRKRQKEVRGWLAEGKTAEEINALSVDFCWDDIVEQDENLWARITQFISRNQK